jgi:hypothetical protein
MKKCKQKAKRNEATVGYCRSKKGTCSLMLVNIILCVATLSALTVLIMTALVLISVT